MATVEDLAVAILRGEILEARELAREIARCPAEGTLAPPRTQADHDVLIVAAAMAELLADRHHWARPAWTASVGGLDHLLDLLPATSARLRELLMREVPEPLRKRNILAPHGFLAHV